MKNLKIDSPKEKIRFPLVGGSLKVGEEEKQLVFGLVVKLLQFPK